MGIGKVIPIHDYVDIQRQTKITLNALSPSGLVSSRHMESMALRSLVFAEESDRYQDIFPQNLLVTYKISNHNYYKLTVNYPNKQKTLTGDILCAITETFSRTDT